MGVSVPQYLQLRPSFLFGTHSEVNPFIKLYYILNRLFSFVICDTLRLAI